MSKFDSKPDIATYRNLFHFFLLALVISIIYSNSLVQEWHFDDFPNIVEDKYIHWENISLDSVWKTVTMDGYWGLKRFSRPVPRLTFAFNYYLTGLHTLSYHITNIIIHIITSVFVYLVFQKTLLILKTKKDTVFSTITSVDVALLGAVLWAIHPLQTQSVVYIVQRMASMAAMFYMMGMFFYIQGRLKNGRTKTILFFSASLFCGILAVLSKENAVLLAISIILYELIFFDFTRRKILYIITLLSLFVVTTACILLLVKGNDSGSVPAIYSLFKENIAAPYESRPFTMIERLMTEPRILLWYLFLVISPISDFLSLESDIVVSSGLFHPPTTIISILVILALLLLSVFYYRKIRIISFAILFFFVNHIVESSFIGLELYFEHRNYLSSIFLYLVIAYGFVRLYKYYRDHDRVLMHYLISFFIVCILISEGNATYLRNDAWQTEETLHRDNLVKAPDNIRPSISLSAYYLRTGNIEESLKVLRDAEVIVNSGSVRIQKNWIGLLYHNIGSSYYRLSEFDTAKNYLLKSLEYDQYSWETHILLGMIFFMEDDLDRSIRAYTNAVNLHPDDAKLYNLFGRALYAAGKHDIAVEALNTGLELAREADSVELVKLIHYNLMACYLALEDRDNAQRTLNELEEYFDYLSYKTTLNSKQNMQPLDVYNDKIYLLYKSILYPKANADSLEKLAYGIISTNEEYCTEISELKENNILEIVYPPIDPIEEQLSNIYYEEMGKLRQTMAARMENSQNCPEREINPDPEQKK